MDSTLQVRIDKKTKERARRAFRAAGIDLSSGLRLFLTHVSNTGVVPHEMFTYDNAPDSFKKKLVREAAYALKHGKAYTDVRAMHREILGEK